MNSSLKTIALLAVLLSVKGLTAQTTYSVNHNTTYSAAGIPASCSNCVINIADGVTLTIDKNIYLQNVAFNGGPVSKSTIVAKNEHIVFWSTGSFTNIIGNFQSVNLINTALVTFTNSAFSFTKNSVLTLYSSISLVSSTWKLLDNSEMTSTGGVFSIKSGSLTVGDGTPSSRASAIFNGGSLNLQDATSFVTLATNKNSYFNWSTYNGNGVSRTTTNNNLNCGGSTGNTCSAPMLYGPSSLTAGGVSGNAMLPVKLASFTAKVTNNTVVLNWITSQEINSEVFEIERSIDGLHWTRIGSVAAKGNSWTPSKYSYIEMVKNGSTFTYRLKMVDHDAKFEYSSIVKITLDNVVTSGSAKVYPNPASEFFAVDGVSSGSQLVVVNMSGAIIKVINNYTSNSKVALNGMLAGNYVVKITNGAGASQTFKMIITR